MLDPDSDPRLELYRKHVSPQRVSGFESLGWHQQFVEASACTLTDAAGRRYLDMTACFGAVAIGHHHPQLDAANVQLLGSGRPFTLPFGIADHVGELAARLCALADCGLGKVYFCNSGAGGIEAALKFAMIATGRSQFEVMSR